MFVHTLHNVGGPDTSSAAALVFLVPNSTLSAASRVAFDKGTSRVT